MKRAMLICPRCRYAEYADARLVGKKFFCPSCGNLALVVDQENLKKIDLSKLNIKKRNSSDPRDSKFIVNDEEEYQSDVRPDYRERILNEIENNANREDAPSSAGSEQPVQETDRYASLFVVRIFNSIYDNLRESTSPAGVTGAVGGAVRFSQYIISLVALFLMGAGCILGVRLSTPELVLMPVLLSLAMFLGQYVSIKSLNMIDMLQDKGVRSFSSESMFRINAVICLVAIVSFAIFTIHHTLDFTPITLGFFHIDNVFVFVLTTFLIFALLFFLLLVFLYPRELLGTEINPRATAAEECLSLFSINIRALLRITPLIYFVGCIALGTDVLVDFGSVILGKTPLETEHPFIEDQTLRLFFFNLYMPLLVYYFSLFCYFLIDLLSAILKNGLGKQ